MRKHNIFLTVLVSVLVACSPAALTDIPVSLTTPTLELTATPAVMPCTLLHFPVTPESALGDAFEAAGHVTGPASAPVTIIAFSDYQCLPCAFLAASLRQIRLAHPTDVRIIYINSPQTFRDKDNLAFQAVEAADLQEKFWEMHDLFFEKQADWISLTPADFETWAVTQADSLGMDAIRFRSDFEGPVVADRLQRAVQLTEDLIMEPPLLFVNSTSPYTSLADFASLDTVVRLNALSARQFSTCPPVIIDPLKQYIVTLHTAKGDVIFQLYPEKTPFAANNFVFLARSGWYNGVTFFRVLPGNLVMTGDPSETGLGNPGYLFVTEIAVDLRFDQPGMIAMDNNGPYTNGSRFFITIGPAAELTGKYTIIGQVLSGLDVLSALTARDPLPGIVLPPGDELISVTVEER